MTLRNATDAKLRQYQKKKKKKKKKERKKKESPKYLCLQIQIT